ncbi:LIM domain and actin-binding protein 1 [Dinochytrium kinnereticum]|nr:LIM domain and actin-binding protein 1 [Dinochytrium kinnereticum]
MKSDIAARVQFYNTLDEDTAKTDSPVATVTPLKSGSKTSSVSGSLTSLGGHAAPKPKQDLQEAIQHAVATTPSTVLVASNAVAGQQKKTPSSAGAAAAKFGSLGGGNKCATCAKTVYAMEELSYDGKMFHKGCLKCAHCNTTINLKNIACLEGQYYCKPHFKQLFKLKGNYAEGFGKEDHKKQWSQGTSGTA